MATLKEQVKEIMNERTSKKVKEENLLKLGLTSMDVRQLFHAEMLAQRAAAEALRQARAAAIAEQQRVEEEERAEEARLAALESEIERILERYTFGVEIECYNVIPSDLVANAHNKGVGMRHEGYNHRDNRTYYKLVSDASIHGNNPIECVSPVLEGTKQGFDSLKNACDSLNEVGAMVNRSTGLHVHVGGNINRQQYCNVFNNYYYMQNVIDTFLAPSRRNGRWGKHLGEVVTFCNDHIEILTALNYDRYHAVNPCSWERHQTIEFRAHQGSTEYAKISAWAKFCIKLVDWSNENRLHERIRTIDEIAFLTDEEKAYFKGRAEHFANR